jgi:hypothetical protein
MELFERQHSNGEPCSSWIVAAWQWIITYRKPNKHTRYGLFCKRIYKMDKGFNFKLFTSIPSVGSLSMDTQPNMPLKKD